MTDENNNLITNLFGKPSSTAVPKIAEQPSTVTKPNSEQTQVSANGTEITNVQNQEQVVPQTPSKGAMIGSINKGSGIVNSAYNQPGNPNGYLNQYAQVQQSQKDEYVPDQENKGRGVANWFKKVFAKPETEAQRKRQIQRISAVGDFGRLMANLIGVSRGAAPQNIIPQTQINEAKWKEEDALKAANAKAQRDYELKLAKQREDSAYKAANLAYKEREADRADANLRMNQGRYAMDAERFGWQAEDRPYDLASKAAGVRTKVAQADEAETKAKYADAQQRASLQQKYASIAASNASRRHSDASTAKIYKEMKDGDSGKEGYNLSGNQGKYTRKKALSQDERTNIITRAYKEGIIDQKTYTACHSKSSWTSDVEFQTKQSDVIATILASEGDNAVVQDIMTSHGFSYTPYSPTRSKTQAHFK